ncbi:antirepressor, partial [Aneurinibacillus migulanus]
MNQLQIIQHNGQRVLTTAQLAEAYGTDNRRVSENFNANKERYTEGKHFFLLQGDDLKEFGDQYGNSVSVNRVSKMYLWTEKGAWMHAKSLNTDK